MGLPLSAVFGPISFPSCSKTAISFPAGPLTQIITDPNEQHYQFKKRGVRRMGLQWPAVLRNMLATKTVLLLVCTVPYKSFGVLSMTSADTSYKTDRKSFLYQEFTLSSCSMHRSIKIGIHLSV